MFKFSASSIAALVLISSTVLGNGLLILRILTLLADLLFTFSYLFWYEKKLLNEAKYLAAELVLYPWFFKWANHALISFMAILLIISTVGCVLLYTSRNLKKFTRSL